VPSPPNTNVWPEAGSNTAVWPSRAGGRAVVGSALHDSGNVSASVEATSSRVSDASMPPIETTWKNRWPDVTSTRPSGSVVVLA